MANPVIHNNPADPMHQIGNVKNAKSKLNQRITPFYSDLRDYIATFKTNDFINVNAKKYIYELDENQYTNINNYINELMNKYLLDSQTQSNPFDQFWLDDNLNKSSEQGVKNTIQSIKNISPTDFVGVDIARNVQALSADEIINSPEFKDRIRLLKYRTFNLMKGLTYEMRVDLSETLTRGMLEGKGIKQITSDIKKRVGVIRSRALRIARTEILNAYRTASRNQTEKINDTVFEGSDFEMLQLWASALTSTTRSWHASRHGLTYTPNQVEQFYSVNGNAINCYCSQVPTLVNKQTGKKLQWRLMEKMEEQKVKWFEIKGKQDKAKKKKKAK